MKYCRSCRRIWPSGALYCGTCHRTFGARLCPKGHRNPVGARSCTTCGNRKLTTPVRSFDLHFPALLIAMGLALILLRLMIQHLDLLLSITRRFANAITSFLFGASMGEIVGSSLRIAVIGCLVWLAIRKMVGGGDTVKAIEKGARNLAIWAVQFGVAILKAVFRWAIGVQDERSQSSKARRGR